MPRATAIGQLVRNFARAAARTDAANDPPVSMRILGEWEKTTGMSW